MKVALSGAAGRLLPALALVNLLLVSLLWFAETFIAERHWLTILVTYAPQHPFGVPTLLLLAAAAWRRNWLAGVASVVAGAICLFALLGLRVPLGARQTNGGIPIRVMTYNIHEASAGAEKVAEVIRRLEPDVVCLQEARPPAGSPDPVAVLKELLPGWHVARHGEVAIFSRHPIRAHQGQNAPLNPGRAFLRAELSVQGRRLSLIAVHLTTAAHPGRLLRNPGPTADQLRATARVRAAQVDTLLAMAEALPAPRVIAGDFNTPPRGRLYRRLTRHHRDAFDAAGRGFGHTFRTDRPVLRIDHILTTPDLRVDGCFVPRESVSDHLPLVADLRL